MYSCVGEMRIVLLLRLVVYIASSEHKTVNGVCDLRGVM
jgi:hypothetical protein